MNPRPVPRRRRNRLAPDPRRRNPAGMVTLEWLLVIAAAGGFAAAMAAGLDGLTADHTALTPREHSTHAASRTAAARINDRALAALIDASAAQAGGAPEAADAAARLERLRSECETLPAAYPAAVQHARWHWQPIPALTDVGTDSQFPAGTPEPATPPLSDEGADPAAAPRQPDEPGRAAAEGRWTCRLDGPAR